MSPRRVIGACAAALLVALAATGQATPASADGNLAQARARASALQKTVDRLDGEAEAAAEDYGAAEDALGQVVSRLLSAEQQLDEAHQTADVEAARNDDVAAQMYMSGGPGALYATVLDGADISDVLDRIASVDSVVRGDIASSAAAQAGVVAADATRADLALLTAQRRELEARLESAAQRVATLQAQAAAELASADSLVLRLVAEARAAQEAAAEAAARATALPWAPEPVPADAYSAMDRAIAEATAAPATPYAVGAIRDARAWLGTPYSAGGGSLDGPTTGWCSNAAPDNGRASDGSCAATGTVGFDCSSLMVRIFHAAGRALPRTSREQWKIGVHVALADLQPGDLLFWAYDTSNPASIHHVAMYLGHGLMVQAPHTGGHVEVAPVYMEGLIGAVRPV